MSVLKGLEGPGDIPLAVNDAGQIVGWYRRGPSDLNKAFLWTNGVIKDLGTLGESSVGIGINNSGQVVGRSDVLKGPFAEELHAYLWTASGGIIDLGAPDGPATTQANDINNLGLVVGELISPDGIARATLWRIK
jgi:probable HAF family extracellular repeat protein